LAKEKIIAARKQTSNVQPEQLHLPSATKLDSLQIYQHLTPRLQELLFEANKYKRANNFKFCWVKNKIVCLRKSENEQSIKLTKLQDLTMLN
jgi:nitrous oxide reductase accessory protein NosL